MHVSCVFIDINGSDVSLTLRIGNLMPAPTKNIFHIFSVVLTFIFLRHLYNTTVSSQICSRSLHPDISSSISVYLLQPSISRRYEIYFKLSTVKFCRLYMTSYWIKFIVRVILFISLKLG